MLSTAREGEVLRTGWLQAALSLLVSQTGSARVTYLPQHPAVERIWGGGGAHAGQLHACGCPARIGARVLMWWQLRCWGKALGSRDQPGLHETPPPGVTPSEPKGKWGRCYLTYAGLVATDLCYCIQGWSCRMHLQQVWVGGWVGACA